MRCAPDYSRNLERRFQLFSAGSDKPMESWSEKTMADYRLMQLLYNSPEYGWYIVDKEAFNGENH